MKIADREAHAGRRRSLRAAKNRKCKTVKSLDFSASREGKHAQAGLDLLECPAISRRKTKQTIMLGNDEMPPLFKTKMASHSLPVSNPKQPTVSHDIRNAKHFA